MENVRAQQIEALEVAVPYCEKISTAMNNVICELEEKRLPDTQEYLDNIMKGLNWIIQVYNGTKDIINEKEQVISKDEINASVVSLNTAFTDKDDKKIAKAIREMIVFVDTFKNEAQKLCSENK